ncbi:MAG: hypothetical protein KGQ66_13080 [Acidobacteriota bacterium]|nr:hypothetical protein [Acidobacteriota bacterium]
MTTTTVDARPNARKADRLAAVLAQMADSLDVARQEEGSRGERALASVLDAARQVARLLPASTPAAQRKETIAGLAGRLWMIRPLPGPDDVEADAAPAEGTPAGAEANCCMLGRAGDGDVGAHSELLRLLTKPGFVEDVSRLLAVVEDAGCVEDRNLTDLLVHHFADFEQPTAVYGLVRDLEDILRLRAEASALC